MRLFVLTLMYLMVSAAWANTGESDESGAFNGYYKKQEEGRFWYKDEITEDPVENVETAPEEIKEVKKPENEKDPLVELKEYQEKLDRAKARAVLHPTSENIREYQELQQATLNRAGLFADVWRRNVWANPELDYSQTRPTATIANNTFKSNRRGDIKNSIKKVGSEYGIYFFFKSTCPYCHKFSPILQRFARENNVTVIPVSLDSGTLPGYENARHDVRVAKILGVSSVPAVFLVQPKQEKIIPVSNNLISLSELEERIYILTQTEPGEDY
jgi:conjugal transfer pilus assembly protein TraF